jgi:predicted aldo/keto reductase-like oxidoreductase
MTLLASQDMPAIGTPTLDRATTHAPMPFMRRLGRTGLEVSCLGIGGGNGIASADVLHAYEHGINYFFFSGDLHHFQYARMADALRKLCGRGSAERERIVLALVTYVKSPEMVFGALFDQFAELGIDYIDVFFWGWLGSDDANCASQLFRHSPRMRGPDSKLSQFVEGVFGASERLRRMGAVRHVGASFHDTALAGRWADSPELDVVMVRHNAAHRTAQSRVLLPAQQAGARRPGIVTFKSQELVSPTVGSSTPSMPADGAAPDAGDLYRYSLSQPMVDVCLTGPRTRADIDGALAAVARGYLSGDELCALERYGDLARARSRAMTQARAAGESGRRELPSTSTQ